MSSSLAGLLLLCRDRLPEPFRTDHARLFHEEHAGRLAARLLAWHEAGPPAALPPPHLPVECTPPPAEVFAAFAPFLAAWDRDGRPVTGEAAGRLAEALAAAGTRNVLLALGQRLTPGSLTDARAIPRPGAELLAAADRLHAGRLSVGARALTKHLQRTELKFWGEMRGGDQEKNETARGKIAEILAAATWWNVFEHYKHAVVFEARNELGYGARWGDDGGTFIGFLEPFTPGFPLERGGPDGAP